MASDFWTADGGKRVEELKALVAEGMTFGQIARLWGCTRNMILSKAARVGLRTESVKSRPKTRIYGKIERGAIFKATAAGSATSSPSQEAVEVALVSPPPLLVREVPPDYRWRRGRPGPCTLMQLESWSCRMPLGPLMERAKFYCGERAVDGLPYCSKCAARCYNAVTPRIRAYRRGER